MSGRVPDDWQEYIRLGIDYGTGYLKLAVQYIYPGRNENSQDINDVYLEDLNDIAQEVAIEQVAVWTLERGLIWGKRPVHRWIQEHPEDRKFMLSAWKLALMANFKDREIVQQTIKALGSPTSAPMKAVCKTSSRNTCVRSKQELSNGVKRRTRSIPFFVQIGVSYLG
jgi:hypothetical protein